MKILYMYIIATTISMLLLGANEQTIVCGARAVKLFVLILGWSKSCMKRFKKLREIIDVHVQYYLKKS
jgi:hypothetical protein